MRIEYRRINKGAQITMYNKNVQLVIAIVLLVVFVLIGLMYGAQPPGEQIGAFGDVLRAFALTPHTRWIIAFILIDWITSLIAAYSYHILIATMLAQFIRENVVPYLFGFLLFWFITFYGLIGIIGATLAGILALLGFAAIMASLTASIIDNIIRASHGAAVPHDVDDGSARG
jgi:hypothetical protein